MTKDLIQAGRRFGWLKVIGPSPKRDAHFHTYQVVECACGKVKEVLSTCLLNGSTTSCGCKVGLLAAKRRAGRYVPSFREDD